VTSERLLLKEQTAEMEMFAKGSRCKTPWQRAQVWNP